MLAFLSPRTQIIAVSHATARAFSGRLPFAGRVQVVYNGTDLNRFPLKRPGDAPLKREWGLSSDSFLLCTVGQICPRKGLRELLEAFTRCCDAVPRMHLAIVGEPLFPHDQQYRNELVALAASAGIAERVHFAGQRSDISSVLQSADLLVLNSREEPFGLVLIEAMASGTPVLATRVGGIPEIVTDSADGFLVESGDTAGLAARLIELSRRPQILTQVARSARERTCPRFSIAEFQTGILRVYQNLERRKQGQPAQPDRALEIQ
jgi:glycosyltransferase involved in cell wall biosynthesis